MTAEEISITRLFTQQISCSKLGTPGEVTHWMGAVQAQDFMMSKWALGLRLQNGTEKDIDGAINKAEIIRTHVLRPTWHWVSAANIHWMLALTGPRIKASTRARHIQLGIDRHLLKKARSAMEKCLKHGLSIPRKEMLTALQRAGIDTGANRASHLLLDAELEGLICSGPLERGQPTYALLDERVPVKKGLTRDESLYRLARQYFQSHAPATSRDFSWWSGLTVSEAKRATAMIDSGFLSEKINGSTYLFPENVVTGIEIRRESYLLPAFDEYLISYKDRSPSIHPVHGLKTFSTNGIFRPTIVQNGKVTGTWKRELKNNQILITAFFFDGRLNRRDQSLEKEVKKFGSFSGRRVVWQYG